MSWVEILGFATGALCVWLTVRRNVWTFPIGMANNVFFWVLFASAGLYADAWLQVVYLVLGAVGWYWWLHGGEGRTKLGVRSAPRWVWPAAIVGVGVLTGTIYVVLTSHTDSTVPQWDALTTGLSLVAQVLLNRKWIANWWFWIAADVIYVGLYAYKGLYLTAVLYALFLGLCVVGLRQWRAAARSERAASALERVPA